MFAKEFGCRLEDFTGGKVNIIAVCFLCVGSNFESRPTQWHVTALYV